MKIKVSQSFNAHRSASASHHGGHHRFDGSALAMMVLRREMKE